jgi:hypothetical protein
MKLRVAFRRGLLQLLTLQQVIGMSAEAVTTATESERPSLEAPGSSATLDTETKILRSKLDRSPITVLPPIEARSYDVLIARRSSSQRVYLFDDPTGREPQVGRILVLKRGEGEDRHNVMAFRIVRVYPERKQFAVRRIRWYLNYRVLDPGMSFLAIEKKGDLKIPSLSTEDIEDLNEVEGGRPIPGVIDAETDPSENPHSHLNRNLKLNPYDEGVDVNGVRIKKYDPMLDAGDIPPPVDDLSDPAKNGTNTNDTEIRDIDDEVFDPMDSEDDEALSGIDEIRAFEPHHHSLSAELGAIRNNGPNGSSGVFKSPLFRYSFNPTNTLFVRNASVQDSFTVEVALGGYNVSNFSGPTAGDSYTVFFAGPGARYNLFITENIGFFIYGGIFKNWLIASNNASEPHRAALTSLIPAAGGGVLLKIGPSWFVRVNAGYDGLTGGIALRF